MGQAPGSCMMFHSPCSCGGPKSEEPLVVGHKIGPGECSAPSACRSLCGCGVPPAFSVPPDVNVEEEDTQRTLVLVRCFAEMLMTGVSLHLAVNGCDVLLVEMTLDKQLSTLKLVFNGIHKSLPLRVVRNISMEEQSSTRTWHVRLDLEGDQFCTFVFAGSEGSAREASYFGGCLVMLVEAARFQAVKEDLAGLASLCTKTPRSALAGEEEDGPKSTTRSLAGASSIGGGLVGGAPALVAALLAAGAEPQPSALMYH